MTQNNLFSKDANPKAKNGKMNRPTRGKSSLLRHAMGSYWWLAFACGVVYFFAGPVFTLLYLNSMNFDATHYDIPAVLHQSNVEQIARWMSSEGMIPIYLSAVVLSMILGCVMFSYLQHKRQVNFYHSQPIHRTRLFLNQYGVGFAMNMVLMLVMLSLSMLIVVMYGLGEALTIGAILRHILNIVVLSLASYSISVLAGQLTGTVLTHLAMMLLLHFCVPVAMVIVTYIGDIFFATFSMSYPPMALYFSPMCSMILLLTEYSTRYLMYMTAPAMGTSLTLISLAIGIGFAVLSWYLYQKRPSEATGQSLIYPITEPFVKFYLMFVGALAGAFIFYAVGNQTFFYFGLIVFAVLIHMVCQVIIEHDFKALFHKMNQCAVILVLICAVVGVARFDLFGFDRYLPEPDKVQAVSFQLNGVDNYSSTPAMSGDAHVKQHVYALLEPVIEGGLYRTSEFDGYQRSYYKSDQDYAIVHVTYTLNGGRKVNRTYREVPVAVIQDEFAALYDLQAYRESMYAGVLGATVDRMTYMHVNNLTIYSPAVNEVRSHIAVSATIDLGHYEDLAYVVDTKAVDTTYSGKMNGDLPDARSAEAKALAKALLEAYKKDLMNRQFSTLEEVELTSMEVQILEEGSVYAQRGYNSYYYHLPVYPSDQHTVAILGQRNLLQTHREYNYDKLLVFRCDPTNEQELRSTINRVLGEKETGLFTEAELVATMEERGIGELTGAVYGTKEVNQFISDTRLLKNGTLFSTMDETHFAMLQYNHMIDGTDEMEWRSTLFYTDTVPVEYR